MRGETCPVCGRCKGLHELRDRDNGFLICKVCWQCRTGILRDAKELRRRSMVIAYGLALDPAGGLVRLDHHDYHISRSERVQQWGDYPDEPAVEQPPQNVEPETEEQRLARRKEELEKLYPKEVEACWDSLAEDRRRM